MTLFAEGGDEPDWWSVSRPTRPKPSKEAKKSGKRSKKRVKSKMQPVTPPGRGMKVVVEHDPMNSSYFDGALQGPMSAGRLVGRVFLIGGLMGMLNAIGLGIKYFVLGGQVVSEEGPLPPYQRQPWPFEAENERIDG